MYFMYCIYSFEDLISSPILQAAVHSHDYIHCGEGLTGAGRGRLVRVLGPWSQCGVEDALHVSLHEVHWRTTIKRNGRLPSQNQKFLAQTGIYPYHLSTIENNSKTIINIFQK